MEANFQSLVVNATIANKKNNLSEVQQFSSEVETLNLNKIWLQRKPSVITFKSQIVKKRTIKMEKYNHNEMVEWLKENLKKKHPSEQTFETFETFEDITMLREKLIKGTLLIDPRYSVDLIHVEKREEEKDKEPGKKENVFDYTFFLVSTSEITDEKSDEKFGKIIDSFRKRLLFYQFYFSTSAIAESSFKIIVVIPHNIDISSEAIKEFFKYYKLGLWKINIAGDKEEEVVAAKNLRGRMIEEFKESIDVPEDIGRTIKEISERIGGGESTLKEAIKEKAEDFAIFFEQYINDAVDAILGIKPEQIGKRYIDRKLLDLILNNLENVSYGMKLITLVNEQLNEKEDDYLFSKKCFEFLWKKYFDGREYPGTLARFETFLQQLFPEYREHFVHQFQVFLLGTIILDRLFQNPTFEEDKNKKDDLARGWLLTSSIHDFTYPLQKYDEWSSDFFKEQLKIDEKLSFLELKGIYVEKTFLTRVEHLLSGLEKDFIKVDEYEKAKFYNEIRRFFYYEITEKKNHGLMSSSYLLKRFEEERTYEREFYEKVLLPAAVAVAIHDDEIWQTLSGQVNGDIEKKWGYIARILNDKTEGIAKVLANSNINNEEKERRIASILREKGGEWFGNIYTDICSIIAKKPLPELDFKSQPLTFLLILCDKLQDCGRPCVDKVRSKEIEIADIRLKNISFDSESSTLTIQLYFNDAEQTLDFMSDKIKQLRKMESYLKSPDIKFVIEYWDRITGRPKYPFTIN